MSRRDDLFYDFETTRRPRATQEPLAAPKTKRHQKVSRKDSLRPLISLCRCRVESKRGTIGSAQRKMIVNNCEQLQMTIEERRAKNAERMRAWRARNPERAKAIAAADRQRYRAKIAAYRKIYYEKNKATLYEKKKSYLARNGEKLRQWKHADYERHSESYKARAHKRWREKNEECRAYEAKRYRRDKAIIFARHRDYL